MSAAAEWFALNDRAPHGAAWGAYVNGTPVLEIRPGLVVVYGHASFGCRLRAEAYARDAHAADADRWMTRREFDSLRQRTV